MAGSSGILLEGRSPTTKNGSKRNGEAHDELRFGCAFTFEDGFIRSQFQRE